MGRVSDPRARLVVLISGTGSNLQALIDAAAADYPAQVVAVGADRAGIAGLDRAAAVGIPTFVVDPADHSDRGAWDQALALEIQRFEPDWVVSAGFMRILREGVLRAFPDRIVNTHPALLPAFPGAHAVRDAIAYGVKVTGCTIHLVDAGVDTGPVLAQASVELRRDDDEDSLHERIKVLERELLVDTIGRLCRQSLSISGRQVWFQ
ncbi:MAG: phosphoribosylglycinamide formyltransferase [Candidatus Nanopelagicales bacterium]